tara:strand:+ start:6060 stop:7346 length:1287 start_codon:yes stop_codon:yes gene_type:complete
MGFWANLFKSKQQREEERLLALKAAAEKNRARMLLQLAAEKQRLQAKNTIELQRKKNNVPVMAAHARLTGTLRKFRLKRNQLKTSWDVAYENFSWWNKLKYSGSLDLSKLDAQILTLRQAVRDFENTYNSDIEKVEKHFQHLQEISVERLNNTYATLENFIHNDKMNNVSSTTLAAAWVAGLSVPVSIAGDLYASNAVFDALRSVNGNFSELSNSEIWWETLWMSSESLTGLVSLTKGAYFEQLVASDTGGELFPDFNHPDTDITINGIEYQLKATDSAAYINTVDEDITVIATSEVADLDGVIDSGYSNEELTNTVEIAINGNAIDAQDTAVDAILSGVGTLGIFATIKGINHAQAKYDKGVEAEEAIFEGLGVAVEATAKGLVDTAEMASKVVMSRPSRFVGRALVKGLVKLDEKLFAESNKERSK